MKPLVSIIIPAFMLEKYIKETIDSVLWQTFQDFEIIVVDDGSTDGTGEKVLEYKDPRIKYHYQKNSGRPACPRNKGISLSKGDYLAFVDGDDIWLPQKLERQIECFKRNNDLGFVFTNAIMFNAEGEIGIFNKRRIESGYIFKDLFMRAFIINSSVMASRRCLEDVGGFDEEPSVRAIEDYDLWLRISYKYPISFIKEPLTKYRVRNGGVGGAELDRVIREKKYTDIISKKLLIPKHLKYKKHFKMNLKILWSFVKNFSCKAINSVLVF
jgi:glycosyltransferase involved in cell wall biosynthesis